MIFQHDPDGSPLHHARVQCLVRRDDAEVRELRGRHGERHRPRRGHRPQGVLHADVHRAVRGLALLGNMVTNKHLIFCFNVFIVNFILQVWTDRVRVAETLQISPTGEHQSKTYKHHMILFLFILMFHSK